MRVIVTRPAHDAALWVQTLREHRIDALALPLLTIGPAPDSQALAEAWQAVQRYRAVMFVSANAVQGFFAYHAARAWPADVRAWAPGPGTREALLAVGVQSQAIDAPSPDAPQFDSEALWQQVGGQLRAGDRLLLVQGADAHGRGQGRDWIAQQLQAAGATVDAVVAYARLAPCWDAEQLASGRQAAADGSLWLFSSSQAVAQLDHLLPGVDWSAAKALATHPRIAQAARSLGFGEVRETRPGLADVVASIESAR
jgi:uroporphyrinogen-III synthase